MRNLISVGDTVKFHQAENEYEVLALLADNKLKLVADKFECIIDIDDITQVNGFRKTRPTYYQPRLTVEQFEEEGQIASFDVYRNYENAYMDFPDTIIDVYHGSDIECHTFIDDESGESPTYYVDVPNPYDGGDEFTNLYTSHDKSDCILFAQLHFHADVNGMISMISES